MLFLNLHIENDMRATQEPRLKVTEIVTDVRGLVGSHASEI